MTVTVEPLAIGSLEGPRVWIVTRRVGGHLDIEEAPPFVDNESSAKRWASRYWGVGECAIKVKPIQVVDIEP